MKTSVATCCFVLLSSSLLLGCTAGSEEDGEADDNEDTGTATAELISGCTASASLTRVGDTARGAGTLTCNRTRTISATVCVFEHIGACQLPYYCNERFNKLACTTNRRTIAAGSAITAVASGPLLSGTHRYVASFNAYDVNASTTSASAQTPDKTWTR